MLLIKSWSQLLIGDHAKIIITKSIIRFRYKAVCNCLASVISASYSQFVCFIFKNTAAQLPYMFSRWLFSADTSSTINNLISIDLIWFFFLLLHCHQHHPGGCFSWCDKKKTKKRHHSYAIKIILFGICVSKD